MESKEYGNTITGGEASLDPTEARPLLEMWVVVPTNGTTITIAKNEAHANAKAVCYDVDYPSLGPHRAVRMIEVL